MVEKCKNIECNNEVIDRRIYCSSKCQHYYVNKYIRDYSKFSNTFKKKKEQKEKEYYKNPNICKECSNIIPFNIKDNSFCNHTGKIKSG